MGVLMLYMEIKYDDDMICLENERKDYFWSVFNSGNKDVIANFDQYFKNKLSNIKEKHVKSIDKVMSLLNAFLKFKEERMNSTKQLIKDEKENYKEIVRKIKSSDMENKDVELNKVVNPKIFKDKFQEEQSKIKKLITKERIDALLVADTFTCNYEIIIHKTFKTTEDKDIMDAHYIKCVFGLDRLSEHFLKHIKHMSQVDNFQRSLIYLASDDYKRRYIDKHKG
jgi:hypothetical protein